MSADAWRVCPRCRAGIAIEKAQKAASARIAATEAYGKVPAEEYRTLDAAALEAEEALIQDARLSHVETLREDYEIWTDEAGHFFISYSCSCTSCDFEHNFRHEEQLTV